MKIVKSLTELIGNTPVLELVNFRKAVGFDARIFAKLEYFNPLGSVKDRVGAAMLADGEARGLVKDGTVIIEPTSGNTGIALAFACAAKGYRLILTMPDSMSKERRGLLKALGAEIVLTEGGRGMSGAIEKAEEIAADTPNSFIAGQFRNPANPEIHRKTTALEIVRDFAESGEQIDFFVCGVGTGGTFTGVGEVLKEKFPEVKLIAVEPSDSPVLSGGCPAPHKIQGIGAGFVPDVYNADIADEVICAGTEQSVNASRILAETEGLLVGFSSGAAAFAASELASRRENAGKSIVVIFPDTGERYLSSGLYNIEM
ncbi:MAG: cysteine synthase A [Oscillospiraceae bacterium]|nr:cysteine synthase A [Oscillospiraceae bacterium]